MKVFIIAGEQSGDKLGGAVMAGLRQLHPEVVFEGVGGPLMQGQGLQSQFDMDELSVMGLAEILPKYRALKRRINETAAAIIATKPDVLLTIDSPDFCLRVAKLVRARAPEIRTTHYVAPTIWAWRAGRAKKIKGVIDQLLALFPFEPSVWAPHNIRCDFVGHPVVAEEIATEQQALAFRSEHNIRQGPLVLALPGSRNGEVSRLSDRFEGALKQLLAHYPEGRVVIPMAAPVVAQVRARAQNWPGAPILIAPTEDIRSTAKRSAFRAADVALAASGTVSLELAAVGTPMVIAYDMAWASRQIISRMLKVDTVTLVNLVSETRTIPEFIGDNCQPGPIAAALSTVLNDSKSQQTAMTLTMERLGLGQEAPGLRAAKAIMDAL